MKTAVEIIEQYDVSISGSDEHESVYTEETVTEAMEEYASQFQPQWIKINSEADLPDHTNDVIALVANEPIQSYFINGKWMGSYDVRSSVKDGWGGDFELCGQSTVTHWMPLPQPPKQD